MPSQKNKNRVGSQIRNQLLGVAPIYIQIIYSSTSNLNAITYNDKVGSQIMNCPDTAIS